MERLTEKNNKGGNIEEERKKEKEIYRQAIEKWEWLQKIVAIEEMSELQKELSKNLRGKDNRENIAEEVADVEIMLEQMKVLYDIEDDVAEWKKAKIERLAKRLNN